MKKLLTIFTLIVIAGYYVIGSLVALQGPEHCLGDFAKRNKLLFEKSVEMKSISTRTIDANSANRHFVSGWVIQPKDITQGEKTIVCHFRENTYVIDKIEIFEGDFLDKVKAISSSNFHPFTQSDWLIFNLENW